MRTLLASLTALFLFSSFNGIKKNKLKLPKEFEKIPAGSFLSPNENISKRGDSMIRVSVNEFYISAFEVSNLQYRQFLSEASPGMTEAEKEKTAIDTAAWKQLYYTNEPKTKNYYSHPFFNNYPVVNVSYDGAVKYCEWLQQKIQQENPGFIIEVKLPTKNQWMWVAQGGRKSAMFPWGNYYLRNKKGKPMCNFKQVNEGAVYRNRKTGKAEVAELNNPLLKRAFTTTAVKSFYPNDYGLYNMCGNAAEIIEEEGNAWVAVGMTMAVIFIFVPK